MPKIDAASFWVALQSEKDFYNCWLSEGSHRITFHTSSTIAYRCVPDSEQQDEEDGVAAPEGSVPPGEQSDVVPGLEPPQLLVHVLAGLVHVDVVVVVRLVDVP